MVYCYIHVPITFVCTYIHIRPCIEGVYIGCFLVPKEQQGDV